MSACPHCGSKLRNDRSLSPKMLELVEFVSRFNAANGYPPSLRECAAEMGVTIARVHRLSDEAERRGALTRYEKLHRSIRVVVNEAANCSPRKG